MSRDQSAASGIDQLENQERQDRQGHQNEDVQHARKEASIVADAMNNSSDEDTPKVAGIAKREEVKALEEDERHERQFTNSMNPQIHAVQESKLVKEALGDIAEKEMNPALSVAHKNEEGA
ncbi:hypothetical protein SeMB42_g00554 [Synchytrium endobioticum]|uniref:Uncharacterized protein n=1 Tax=Synchytrium endobioticum TaxID=286115 RepID=A0A507DEN1_9FUNG|nr:hypothetical protein SeLEV6574_g01164 [Synchytrium endobioticum]TPX53920.1 hypothetical protein SeMB42_g00554 [Synchytrium endobioticum]